MKKWYFSVIFSILFLFVLHEISAQQLVWEEHFDGSEVPENFTAYTLGDLVLYHSIETFEGNNVLRISGSNAWDAQTQIRDLNVDVSAVPIFSFKYMSKTEKDEKFRLSVEIFRDGGSTGTFYPEFEPSEDSLTEVTIDISGQIFGTSGIVTGFTIWLDPSNVRQNNIDTLYLDDIKLGGVPPDVTAPVLSAVTTGQVDIGMDVTATSNEKGYLYLVPVNTRSDTAVFNNIVNSSEGKKVSCIPNVATLINTSGLSNGFYQVFASDSSGNISLPSEAIIVGVMPVLSGVTSGNIAIGDQVTATCNLDADIFLVPSSTNISISDFESVVNAGNGLVVAALANTPVIFETSSLTDDQYTVYAVDNNRNISEPSEIILIGDISKINIVIKPQEYEYALKNPLKGFRKRLHGASHPLVSLERFYIKWNDLENDESDGIVKIKAYCNSIWSDLPEKNNKAIPRVYLEWPDKGKYWPDDMQEGDYTSEQFEYRLKRLIERLGECWDNDSRVAFIEMGIIGKWGEQHSPTPTEEIQWLLGETFRMNFRNKKVMVRCISDPYNPWQSGEANILNLFDFGVYWDAYGTDEQWADEFYKLTKAPFNQRWKTEVMGGEVSYNYGTPFGVPVNSPDNNPDYTVINKTQDVVNMVHKIHTNHLGWISNYTVGSLTDKGANTIQKAFGYRFVIDIASFPALLSAGGDFKFTFSVTNTGSTPFYYKWPVEISLLNPTNHEVVWSDIFENVDITQWMPGDKWDNNLKAYLEAPNTYTCSENFTLPSDISDGEYILALAILDPAGMRPAARFAIENYFNGGRHPIGKVGVGITIPDYSLHKDDFNDIKFDLSLNYDKVSFDIPYLIDATSGIISDGDYVYATCNQDASIYLVPQFTNPNHISFEEAVAGLKGLKIEANADVSVQFNPESLEAGRYKIYAVNKNAFVSKPSELITIGSFPVVYDASTGRITKGDLVTAKSNMDGYLFLAPIKSIPIEKFLDNAVIDKKAKKVLATADQLSQISTLFLDPGNYYIYAVNDEGQVSLPSEMISIELATNVDDVNNYPSASIFPNPASSYLQINNDKRIDEISIYNLYGQHIKANIKIDAKNTNLDISGLKSGVYLIKIEQENGEFVIRRLVKE